jgi:hypothetical protein
MWCNRTGKISLVYFAKFLSKMSYLVKNVKNDENRHFSPKVCKISSGDFDNASSAIKNKYKGYDYLLFWRL